jgi:hypothetical protein
VLITAAKILIGMVVISIIVIASAILMTLKISLLTILGNPLDRVFWVVVILVVCWVLGHIIVEA